MSDEKETGKETGKSTLFDLYISNSTTSSLLKPATSCPAMASQAVIGLWHTTTGDVPGSTKYTPR
jgi:hypothetical protein